MEAYEAKCKALLDNGRDQNGKWAEKKDRELSFYRHMYHYYKRYFKTIYSQAIIDQQQIISELKDIRDHLISEKNHNKRLKQQIEILKKNANR